MLKKLAVASLLCWCVTTSAVVSAQEPVKRPRVFLDKNPRIVAYQLKRLSNEQLLLVQRATDHTKYNPVFTAILARAGMSRQHRDEALAALVTLEKSDAVEQLLVVLEEIDEDDRQELRVGRELAAMLLGQSSPVLMKKLDALRGATDSENALLRATGYAGLVSAGAVDGARTLAARGADATLDFLSAVALVPKTETRLALRESVVASLSKENSEDVRRAAVKAFAHVPGGYAETFRLVAPLVADKKFKTDAVRTLLKVPGKHRPANVAGTLVAEIVKQAEATPAAQRTTDEFLDAMQLADQLFALLPVDAARSYRTRLSAVAVRVVIIHTVEEEMRYDVPFFAVEAGRDVQIVLKNEDLMPHNLVVTVPGALKEVALEGATLAPEEGADGKLFVPKSDKVLFATNMVPS
ncbi:MAG: azurin, partial [Planctomycetaceae bacterium]|nr:azurin [Planctomycetaceae bacterium]